MQKLFSRLFLTSGGALLATAAVQAAIGTAYGAVPVAAAVALSFGPEISGPTGLALLVSGYIMKRAGQWEHPDEVVDMGRALKRVGLAERVDLGNLYCADLMDENWRNLFASDEELWAFFGPCWEDAELRARMAPALRAKMLACRRH